MTEIDKTSKNLTTTQTKRSVLARFIANFSGGVTHNTMVDSGKTSMALVSAGLDSTRTHVALQVGGHSKTRLQGSFTELVPVEGAVENALQQLPNKVVHIAEGDVSKLIEEAPKPAVMTNDPNNLERPSRVFYINVYAVNEEPDDDIKHLFNRKLKSAA